MIPDFVWRDSEKYLSIPSHPGIFISSKGQMISYRWVGIQPKGGIMHREPRIVKGSPDKDGYLFITYPKIHVHTLVITLWQGPRPKGLEVRHLDGNKLNNASSNLVWGTSKENGKDKANHGSCKGARNGSAKMTEEFVLNLREEGKDMPLNVLMLLHPEFSKFALWAALTGYTWTHLPNAKASNRKCSKEGWKSGVRLRS